MFSVDRIGQMRKQLGLTQKQLADLSGVSQSLIAKIESKRIDPAHSKVVQILSALESVQNKDKKTVKEIMTPTIVSVRPDEKVSKAIKLMRNNDISQIPVLEDHRCIGSVSEGAVLELVSRDGDLKSTKVKEILQESFPIIPCSLVVDVVIDLLKHYPAVLVEESGKLKGIVTKANMLKAI
jgi:predicted transcriptional regulator